MRNDVERERVHVRGDVAGRVVREDEHEQLRELVRDDVARGPARQAARWSGSPGRATRARSEGAHRPARSAGTSTSAIATMPAVVPMPSSRSRPRSLRTRATSVIAECRADVWIDERDQRDDHHDVVEHGRECGGDEPVARVQERARQRGEAVEDHLRYEAEDQDRQDVQLRGAVGTVSRGARRDGRAAARGTS